MKDLLLASILVFAGAAPARAQVIGYAVGGFAEVSGFYGSSSGFHAVGGGELLAKGAVGGAAEVGVLGGSGGGMLTLSTNAVVHLVPTTSRRRVSPFVSGGYMRMSSAEMAFDGWNIGAGVDLWSGDHVGWRIDFRDHVRPDPRGTVQYYVIRVGIVVR